MLQHESEDLKAGEFIQTAEEMLEEATSFDGNAALLNCLLDSIKLQRRKGNR
ncbi:MAG: hypothetical protein H0U18_07485 [Pyrinomonadaceae bacterium]|nr:hypothetical protein [Pyrinomonadaceae bacterium]